MREELIVAGFGGQGVMFTGTLLAQAAMLEGKFVTFFPAYGAEVRGGTANASVIISDEEIGSPLVSAPDTLIILNQPSLDRFHRKLKKEGQLVVNSTLVQPEALKNIVQGVSQVPASEIAEQLGNIRVANMVALGTYLKIKPVVKLSSVNEALATLLTGKKAGLQEINKKAIKAGYEFSK